eukprot:CAMPEP_0204010190 /NCGR_PEP_ID=MMETSP0360-20130528/22369_1 /ASSEMBLY_ACC=CAM_ASM_000342 /TAXON_ID=268821 /ORGANISM="Scrippsiella Hangoei, Strain SHTV-5" /LENGTH=99 /DNA_ID=CAMNT_0050952625 /DNA_START=102 /DNA_END=398 /DNA_ORIENTATION=-
MMKTTKRAKACCHNTMPRLAAAQTARVEASLQSLGPTGHQDMKGPHKLLAAVSSPALTTTSWPGDRAQAPSRPISTSSTASCGSTCKSARRRRGSRSTK